jgi:hypothetical protein
MTLISAGWRARKTAVYELASHRATSKRDTGLILAFKRQRYCRSLKKAMQPLEACNTGGGGGVGRIPALHLDRRGAAFWSLECSVRASYGRWRKIPEENLG